MKLFLLVIVVAMCLAQNTVRGHALVKRQPMPAPPNVIDLAVEEISYNANMAVVYISMVNANLYEISDNSTVYAGYFVTNVAAEVNAAIAIVNSAFVKASATVGASHGNIQACFTAEQNRVEILTANLMKEVMKCGITKIRQFVELAINLTVLVNSTVNLVPRVITNLRNCNIHPIVLLRVGCVTAELARVVPQLAQIPIVVSATAATGTALNVRLSADLNFCAKAKLFSFRRRIVEIPVAIGVCAGMTVFG